MIKNPHYLFTKTIEKILLASSPPSRRGKCLLVACMPKSGSTYLTKLLANVTGFQLTSFIASEKHSQPNEQDINRIAVAQRSRMHIVVHQHVKGTQNNVHIMKHYNIKPIVLVRNIFDLLPSAHDHIRREKDKGRMMGYLHKQYFDMTEEEQLLYLARIHIPWYFNFLVSWKEASLEIDTFWTSYEEVFADQAGTVSRILEFQGLPADANKIEASIASMSAVDTRLNKGVSGRGEAVPNECKQAILEIADCWKLDSETLAKIGIQTDAKEGRIFPLR